MDRRGELECAFLSLMPCCEDKTNKFVASFRSRGNQPPTKMAACMEVEEEGQAGSAVGGRLQERACRRAENSIDPRAACSPRILLSHIPLWRVTSADCGSNRNPRKPFMNFLIRST
eukprot:760467-Hanusia_phi.AAC.18